MTRFSSDILLPFPNSNDLNSCDEQNKTKQNSEMTKPDHHKLSKPFYFNKLANVLADL